MRALIVPAVMILAAFAPPQKAEAPMPQQSPKLLGWNDLTSRPKPSPTATIKWGAGKTDIADLWLPEGAGPHPVVLMVHGGCWQKSVADYSLMNWAAEDMRKHGLAVWNIEYRGVDEAGGGYPGTFQDVASGADALRTSAPKYNLDLKRVAGFGHSAGGHLILWIAARSKLPKSSPLWNGNPLQLVGVVNSGGLADLKASAPVTASDCLASIMDKLTGPFSAARADVLSDTSPAEMLPLGLHQVAVNGDQDRIAPAILGDGYAKRAKAAGDKAEAVVVPSTGHVELVAPGTDAFEREVSILKEMLR